MFLLRGRTEKCVEQVRWNPSRSHSFCHSYPHHSSPGGTIIIKVIIMQSSGVIDAMQWHYQHVCMGAAPMYCEKFVWMFLIGWVADKGLLHSNAWGRSHTPIHVVASHTVAL